MADTVEYWKRRALEAEKRLAAYTRETQHRDYLRGWEDENRRIEARNRRDREIGEMGGGG